MIVRQLHSPLGSISVPQYRSPLNSLRGELARSGSLIPRLQGHGVKDLPRNFLKPKIGVEVAADGILVQGLDAGKYQILVAKILDAMLQQHAADAFAAIASRLRPYRESGRRYWCGLMRVVA